MTDDVPSLGFKEFQFVINDVSSEEQAPAQHSSSLSKINNPASGVAANLTEADMMDALAAARRSVAEQRRRAGLNDAF